MKVYISDASRNNYTDYLQYKMTKDDNRKLFKEWHENDDTSAREKLITCNLRLVLLVLSTRISKDVAYDQDDLFQIGALALIRAVDTYEYQSSYEFSTYAVKVISNQLNMLWRSFKYTDQIRSLNEVAYENGRSYAEFIDLIPDKYDFTEDLFHQTQLMLIDDMLDSVSDIEKLVICKKYGLRGHQKMTQTEIGKELGVSQTCISRYLRNAINKIRNKWLDKL